MPHRKKKPFIQKKSSVTFHLVHRSQKDPLVADEKAPQRVLLPTERADAQKRKEEERKYGVFFDDAYNYLQHLKEVSPVAELVPSSLPLKEDQDTLTSGDGQLEEKVQQIPTHSINLPSSVFASEFEEETGLLNKAAPVRGPRLDLDPDIVAALDDDFDFDDPDNILEDDFVVKAVAKGSEEDAQAHSDDDEEWEDTEDEDCDSTGALSDDGGSRIASNEGREREFPFLEEETRSRFTTYSMTSSVIRRNEQLTLLDDRFEKLFEEYDDDEIGALDHHELEGCIQVDSTRLNEVISDYHTQKAKDCQMPDDLGPRGDVLLKEVEEEKEETEMLVIEEPTEQWDCESILSTYSNLYNHPKLITDPPKLNQIKVSKKTGVPLDVLPKRNLTAKQLERLETINISDLPRVSTQPRPRDESKSERKIRKQTIKGERKERRMEKKANRDAFKLEKTRQEQVALNLRQNLQGIKL
ncbi:protein LTV1 homolog isoform X1 [Scyliorhinus canicula]|uniref:protein LTV1 homolog isoform X1 n=1 Tax=Scyliorhinus canicula TaxID=7830 RepID=UPI0018F5EC02|nr:protein LTV1 homolog isoform X1 [Scyliorhinus canicula]